ncbi:MAG: hypothetical protein MUC88_13265 [Planctomycetes bacterium]|jgi:hypothetical protein|nr:hypothetical protein [Planctomycetota bacterium]
MKYLALIVILFAAGCSSSRAVHPYAPGTPEQAAWRENEPPQRQMRQAQRGFMFDGHDLPETTVPPGSVPREERD